MKQERFALHDLLSLPKEKTVPDDGLVAMMTAFGKWGVKLKQIRDQDEAEEAAYVPFLFKGGRRGGNLCTQLGTYEWGAEALEALVDQSTRDADLAGNADLAGEKMMLAGLVPGEMTNHDATSGLVLGEEGDNDAARAGGNCRVSRV